MPRLYMAGLAVRAKTINCRRMSGEKLIISTTASREEASRIAIALVQEQLAACVNIVGPIESVYRWQGRVDHAQEFLLLAKTLSIRSDAVIARIRELNSYEMPEAIEVTIDGGNAQYLNWIAESVK